MIKKKNSTFDECLYFVCLRTQIKQKNFRLSVYLSVFLYVRTLGRLQNFSGFTITFEGVSASKQNLVGVFYVRIKCSSGIEIPSQIMILILIRI